MSDIDPDLIVSWKKQFGSIYSIGNDYIARALTLEEHAEMQFHREWSAADAEDYVVYLAVLFPSKEKLERLPAGVFTSLAEEVLAVSGFGDAKFAKMAMDNARNKSDSVPNMMKAFIIAAMPGYTDEDLNKYNFVQLAEKVGLAEKIIQIQREGVSLSLVDPEEEAQKVEKKVKREKAFRKPGQATSSDPIAQKLLAAIGE